MPIAETHASDDVYFRRSRPAAVDIAWAAMENALALAVSQKSSEPIEQLRRPDFIPVGRAIFRLAELMKAGRLQKRDAIATQLRAIRYLQAEISLTYGKRWRVLPEPSSRPASENFTIQACSNSSIRSSTGSRNPSTKPTSLRRPPPVDPNDFVRSASAPNAVCHNRSHAPKDRPGHWSR